MFYQHPPDYSLAWHRINSVTEYSQIEGPFHYFQQLQDNKSAKYRNRVSTDSLDCN